MSSSGEIELTSSTEYSTDSTSEEESSRKTETARLYNTNIQLPQGLCEKKEIFTEFFTAELWNSFSDNDKEHLQTFLPNFPENDDEEKTKTLQRLFDLETFRFSNPLIEFHENLKAGYYRPDIVRMRKIISKAERKEAKYRYRNYREKLKYDLLESHEKLLNQIKQLPPGIELKQHYQQRRKSSTATSIDLISQRTKKRYFQTLNAIKMKIDDTDISSDENYPEGPPPTLSRKQKRHLNTIKNSLNHQIINNKKTKERIFDSTMTTSKLNGSSPLIHIDLEKYVLTQNNPFYINDESYKNMLLQQKKRKSDFSDDPELDTEGITITDIINRTQLPFIKNLSNKSTLDNYNNNNNNNKQFHQPPLKKRLKKDLMHKKSMGNSKSNNIHNVMFGAQQTYSDSDSETAGITVTSADIDTTSINSNKKIKIGCTTNNNDRTLKKIKEEIKIESLDDDVLSNKEIHFIKDETKTIEYSNDNIKIENNILLNQYPSVTGNIKDKPLLSPFSSTSTNYTKISPIKMSDLDTIDIMNTPIELDSSNIDLMELNNPMKPELMQETHANFFSLIRDIICSTQNHRMTMYHLQEHLKVWQENPISPLNDWYSVMENWASSLPSAITFLCGNASEQPEDFVPYMEYKPVIDMYQWIGAGRDTDQLLSILCTFWLQHRCESKILCPIDTKIDIADRNSTPPPPRCPTSWTVKKATSEEISDYREQERRRYDIPHKAFTFRCNGYESIVGPLRGIKSQNAAATNSKARGHSMLNTNRPNAVTLLTLVRDATARLPNGEGTRSDICELLKWSQYINHEAPDNILQTIVSGALDRLHTQWDPCVKYDQKKKIWIYLHRHRSEDDFERICQYYQGVQKVKKTTRKIANKSKPMKSSSSSTSGLQSPQRIVTYQQKNGNSIEQHVMTIGVTDGNSDEVIAHPLNAQIILDQQQPHRQFLPTSVSSTTDISHSNLILTAVPSPKLKTIKRQQSLLQQNNKMSNIIDDKTSVSVPSLVMATSTAAHGKQKSTSLLLSNNFPKQEIPVTKVSPSKTVISHQSLIKAIKKDEFQPLTTMASCASEIIQITNNSIVGTSSGMLKGTISPTKGGQMVKIISPSQGKSVIIPTSNPQILKQIQERPLKTQQQFVHSGKAVLQTKQKNTIIKTGEIADGVTLPTKQQDKMKRLVTTSTIQPQQHAIQSITPQQLQNLKNMALLRSSNNSTQNISLATINLQQLQQTTSTINESQQQQSQNIVAVTMPKVSPHHTEGIQIKTPVNLTQVQTQQILQSIKQKYLSNANISSAQQQLIIKQKGSGLVQMQKPLTLQKGATTVSNNQGPVVAKVLTNSAGHVISVESLLTHQKNQGGGIQAGTTLRVQGTKTGQQNIIHLTANTKLPKSSNHITQFTVTGSQNNLMALTSTGQSKLVVASGSASTTSSINVAPSTITTSSIVGSTKSTPNHPIRTLMTPARVQQHAIVKNTSSTSTPQLINAKLITTTGQQKILQPKVLIGHHAANNQAIKVPSKVMNSGKATNLGTNNSGGLRMVNAANLNLTTIDGKPILFAANKPGTLQNLHGQNIILQAHQTDSSTSSLVFHQTSPTLMKKGNICSTVTGPGSGGVNQTSASNNINVVGQSSNIVFNPTIKSSDLQLILSNQPSSKSVSEPTISLSSSNQHQTVTANQNHIIIGGQSIKLQASTASSNTTNVDSGNGSQRVLLASQGQSGHIFAQQILLPAGFQNSTAINIKSMQGVKVIPIAQAQAKGGQARQIFAKVMPSPGIISNNTSATSTIRQPATSQSINSLDD